MVFIFTKLITALIKPSGFLIIGLIIGIFKGRKYSLLTLGWFLLLSNPLLFQLTIRLWERPFWATDINESVEYGVVLTGNTSYDSFPNRIMLSDNGDRLWQTLKLYQEGKISKILIAGGDGMKKVNEIIEGDVAKAFFLRNGVKKEHLIQERQSRTTYENAVNTRKLLPLVQKVAVISSAFHLPRAIACFKKQGFIVLPYPAMILTEFTLTRWSYFIPQPHLIYKWDWIVKEWYGVLFYKITGKI